MNITLTAGHSSTAPGVCYGPYKEADLMAELTRLCVAELATRGHAVKSDVRDAVNLPLPEAIKMIAGSDVAIEFHLNGSVIPAAQGTEVVALPKLRAKAQALALIVSAALGTRLRGDKGHVLQENTPHKSLGYVNAGGMILEVCFLTNITDRQSYLDNKTTLVTALCNTIEKL
jgi:N-acetylmuramoyl-L-alanine amidase